MERQTSTHSESKGFVAYIDNDDFTRQSSVRHLKTKNYEVIGFSLASDIFSELARAEDEFSFKRKLDLIVLDTNVPDTAALPFVENIKSTAKDIPIIVLVPAKSFNLGIEAVRQGAYDFCLKPCPLDLLEIVCRRATQYRRLKRENLSLHAHSTVDFTFDDLIGQSSEMQLVYDLIQKAARGTASVLITGEGGTEKEAVAYSIHRQGSRSTKPFLIVNGADTSPYFEGDSPDSGIQKLYLDAQGGTLFINEIEKLHIGAQSKLLHLLQTQRIRLVDRQDEDSLDIRIISATSKDLNEEVKEAGFKEDLHIRLNVIPIAIPPLRHRREDIPLFANYFLRKYSSVNNSLVKGFTEEAMDALIRARWEGNVRELETVIERVVVMSPNELIKATEIPFLKNRIVDDFFSSAVIDLPSLNQLEKRYIQLVLEKTGGKKEFAAKILGINRRTLYRKEREYGIVSIAN